MSDAVERGPNYDWKHEAEHYRDECERLRALLRTVEVSSDARIAELEARVKSQLDYVADANDRVITMRTENKQLAERISDLEKGIEVWRKLADERKVRIAELEADLREVRATEAAQRELANANMFLFKQQAERIAELEREKESWGNEFNAVIIVKEQLSKQAERVSAAEKILGEIANCTDPSELTDVEAKTTWDAIFYRVNEFFRKQSRQGVDENGATNSNGDGIRSSDAPAPVASVRDSVTTQQAVEIPPQFRNMGFEKEHVQPNHRHDIGCYEPNDEWGTPICGKQSAQARCACGGQYTETPTGYCKTCGRAESGEAHDDSKG